MIGFLQAFVPQWLVAVAITGAFGWLVGVLGVALLRLARGEVDVKAPGVRVHLQPADPGHSTIMKDRTPDNATRNAAELGENRDRRAL
jgi:hypothetical protein